MSADWPTTGAISVFRGNRDDPELVGFTTMKSVSGVGRFMMTRPSPHKGPGDMFMVGGAAVIERETPLGSYLAWLVITGDPRDMPDFWAA
jgi:hypothetical protein